MHHEGVVEVGFQALHCPEVHYFAAVEAKKRGRVEHGFQLAQRFAEYKAATLLVYCVGYAIAQLEIR